MKTTLNLSPEVKLRLSQMAKAGGVSLSRVIETLVIEKHPTVTFSLSPELLDALTSRSSASGRSVADLVTDTLTAEFLA